MSTNIKSVTLNEWKLDVLLKRKNKDGKKRIRQAKGRGGHTWFLVNHRNAPGLLTDFIAYAKSKNWNVIRLWQW